MAKRQQVADGADPVKTATLLDLLESKGLIRPAQATAGRWFARLRRTIYGRTEASTLDPNHVRGFDTGKDRADCEVLEDLYRQACNALGACGSLARETTEALCVYDRCGALPGSKSPGSGTELASLRLGLDALAQVRTTDRQR